MFADLTGPVGAGAVVVLGMAAAGVLIRRWRLRQTALRSLRAPSQWPIMTRELVTPDEQVLWQWLCGEFAGYPVMIKLPLLRYIALTTPADSAVWHKRLSGVYCTFTVCSTDGTVIGCVDFVGADEDRAHCYLKESILGKCGIPYVMAGPGRWPAADSLRTAFIGEIELSGPELTGLGAPESLAASAELELTAADSLAPAAVDRARSDLQSSLEHRRRQRPVPPGGMPGA
ncbi:MAG: hypothetical protein V4593_00085 [Pseudomonadota bacterium]